MTAEGMAGQILLCGAILVCSALACAVLIVLLRPWLRRYALARPNARSSHTEPTPQGGGIAVVVTALAVAWCAAAVWPEALQAQGVPFLVLTSAAALLALIGAIDDIRTLPPLPRLALQAIAAGAVVAALPAGWQALAMLPWWLERVGVAIGLLWFVNLTNFMDGIDWMTVVEVIPVTGAIAILGWLGALAPLTGLLALALFGATLGFAPFNKPVARFFLGDVGSLPIGLLLGWLLLQVAVHGYVLAALLLPLYYLADATLTLIRRIAHQEPFWEAHRSHFYQRAGDNGFRVIDIVARVFLANLALAAFAIATVMKPAIAVDLISFAAGAAIVGWLLATFARGRK